MNLNATASRKLSSDSFLIRPIEKDDLLELTALDHGSRENPWTKEMFQKELELPFSIHAAVKDEKELIAFGVVWQVKEIAQLIQITVIPDRRGAGIGTFLVKHLMKICSQKGCKIMELEFEQGNIAAKKLYKKLGFKTVGFRKKFYGNQDAILMQCAL
ncbi:MAG: ribosomal protein S18-alanine N-acetyltransferase [Elusimicrobia bacterium]|nr:ribosomal protein S18-alanine N-acetyltransferase [Elusimicrobiota bacterium]